jgi:protein-disulfide isomerase
MKSKLVLPIVQAVQKELGDGLCFAFRNFHLVNAHPHAEHAAEAAEAAGAQGHFWEMHDMLFRTPRRAGRLKSMEICVIS